MGFLNLLLVAISVPLQMHPTPWVCRSPILYGALSVQCITVRLSEAILTASLVSPPLPVLRSHPTIFFGFPLASFCPKDTSYTVTMGLLLGVCRSPRWPSQCTFGCTRPPGFASNLFPLGPYRLHAWRCGSQNPPQQRPWSTFPCRYYGRSDR